MTVLEVINHPYVPPVARTGGNVLLGLVIGYEVGKHLLAPGMPGDTIANSVVAASTIIGAFPPVRSWFFNNVTTPVSTAAGLVAVGLANTAGAFDNLGTYMNFAALGVGATAAATAAVGIQFLSGGMNPFGPLRMSTIAKGAAGIGLGILSAKNPILTHRLFDGAWPGVETGLNFVAGLAYAPLVIGAFNRAKTIRGKFVAAALAAVIPAAIAIGLNRIDSGTPGTQEIERLSQPALDTAGKIGDKAGNKLQHLFDGLGGGAPASPAPPTTIPASTGGGIGSSISSGWDSFMSKLSFFVSPTVAPGSVATKPPTVPACPKPIPANLSAQCMVTLPGMTNGFMDYSGGLRINGVNGPVVAGQYKVLGPHSGLNSDMDVQRPDGRQGGIALDLLNAKRLAR